MDVTHFTHSVECDGLTVHYDLCLPGKGYSGEHKCDNFLLDEDSDYQQRIAAFEEAYSETLAEIERLTYSGDGLDLAMAVSSGLITGLLDVFLVGEWNFKDAKALSNQQMPKRMATKEIGLAARLLSWKINSHFPEITHGLAKAFM